MRGTRRIAPGTAAFVASWPSPLPFCRLKQFAGFDVTGFCHSFSQRQPDARSVLVFAQPAAHGLHQEEARGDDGSIH